MAYGLKYKIKFTDSASVINAGALPIITPSTGGNPLVNGTNTGTITSTPGKTIFIKITLTGSGDSVTGNIGDNLFIPPQTAPFSQTYAIFSGGTLAYNLSFASSGGSCIIESISGCPVEIKILQNGYSGSVQELQPAEDHLIISEVNNSEDLFSAIKAKEIKISFVTDGNIYPGMEDFITANDNDYKAEIYIADVLWLITFLLPDQIQENWLTDNTNHVISLSFTDNLATLRTIALNGFVPTDKPTLYELVKASLSGAIEDLPIRIFDNIFEESMDDRTDTVTNCPYFQCRVDCRTFVKNYTDFEDSYSVLTKILESRNSILFQHYAEWIIIRVPELFSTNTVTGTRYDEDDNVSSITWNAQAAISESGDSIPVQDFMLKTYINALKFNKVIFKYENFDEIFCNQLWKRGAIVLDNDDVKEYEVDCWEHFRGATTSTTPASVDFGRRIEIDVPTGQTKEEYIFLEVEPLSGGESFIRSSYCIVNANDKINISFQRRTKNGYTGSANEILARVLLYAFDGTYYTLDDDGVWYLSNSSFTVNNKFLYHPYAADANRNEWISKEVQSDFIPKDGKIYIHLQEGSADGSTGQETCFKDLRITYNLYLQGKTFINVSGDYHSLTITDKVKDFKESTVYLSDSPKYLVKGALFRNDGETLTTLWYKNGNTDIKYPIKRWNAIERYRLTRRPMQKSEGAFYRWLKLTTPISTVEKIVFSNGAPDKKFLPLSLRDINASKSLFSALFLEVYDTLLTPVNSFTSDASFFGGLKQFLVPVQNSMLQVGNVIEVSGTTANDGTYTITAINRVDIGGVLSTYVYTAEATTEELSITNVIFTVENGNGDNVFAEHEFKYIYNNEK